MTPSGLIHSGNAGICESVSYYQQIIKHLPVAVYICDAQGYILEYNPAAASLWGTSPKAGQDRWCGSWKVYNADGNQMDPCMYPMAVALRECRAVTETEIIIERPDGTRRHVVPHITPLFDGNGHLAGAVNTLRDITEHREFEGKTGHLAAIVASSDDAIVSKTLEGFVTSWNHSAERTFGYTAAEMVGQHISILIPEDRKQEETVILSKLRKGERVDHFETKRVTKDGRLLDISLTISPIRDANGKVIGVSKIVRDITPQKEAEHTIRENEARFRMAVAATRLGTWEYSPLSGKLSWSDECRDIFQIPPETNIDFTFFSKLLHPEDAEMALHAIQQALDPGKDGNYDLKFRILRFGDGKVRWIRSQGKVFFNASAQPEKFIGTVLDITDERVATSALEQKVSERTRDLQEANLKLELSNNELEQFAFVASHDLQEPLRKIQAFGDMLKDKIGPSAGTAATDLINRMQSASARMKTLIDSLLDFSRVSSDRNKHEELRLDRLIGEVLVDMETAVKGKDAMISIGELMLVKGDASQMRQLFQNLIGNALKFVSDGKRPEISISGRLVSGRNSGLEVSANDSHRMFQLIEIKDNGIGFEPEYSGKIFQIFQRLHGKTSYPGSGIGLSIVQKVVSAHNGYIKAIGNPGQGAVFQVLLPFGETYPGALSGQ